MTLILRHCIFLSVMDLTYTIVRIMWRFVIYRFLQTLTEKLTYSQCNFSAAKHFPPQTMHVFC